MAGNSVVNDFHSRLRSKFADDHTTMSMSDWIISNTKHHRKPFSFHGYPFQPAIVDDMHDDVCVIKCSQVGLTEVQLRKFFAFLKRNTGVAGIFTLPNEVMYRRVSSTRAAPIVNQDPVFNVDNGFKPVRRMDLYQIDQSYGYFTGNSEGDATSIPADILFHDELDLSDQQMIGLFQSRLQNSNYKVTQTFSTPTFTGFGIDQQYAVSDQREYLCKCASCNHYNLPRFLPQYLKIKGLPTDLNRLDEIDDEMASQMDLTTAQIVCEKCRTPLDLGNPSLREWVAKRPGASKHGYWVRPFSSSRLPVKYVVGQLLKMKAANNLKGWYNTVLGEPYNDGQARLSENEIRAIMSRERPDVPTDAPVTIGIDVGQVCHVVVVALHQAVPVVVEWLQVPSDALLKQVEYLCTKYNVVTGGMDRHPYEPLAHQIRDETQHRIMPIMYRGADPFNIVTDEFDVFSHVAVNRTYVIDNVANMIRKARIRFAGVGGLSDLIISHFMDMHRVEDPETPAKWEKMTGQDHFFHALVFAMAALRAREVAAYDPNADNRFMLGAYAFSGMNQKGSTLGLSKTTKRPTFNNIGLIRS